MPKRTDIKRIMVIGSGPIVIGQAAEFDYAGTQACLALKEEGYEVILCNSNPATIMTDPAIADKVYMEPLTLEYIAKIIRKERPDALLPGIGGQTGLNLAMALERKGILKECQVELLGTSSESIERAEDRELFKELCESISEPVIPSQITYNLDEAKAAAKQIGYPVVLRPAFTLGGTGGGFANNEADLLEIGKQAFILSPVHQVLIEKSVKGYKEIEYEVIRDHNDTAITVCNMENFDPVGIHTGDSIVFCPSQTLTNKEYQMLRDSALKLIRALKVEGGCNVQFALDPQSSQYYIIEVNPRVSRSSALASKASGYPIARVSAKIGVGLRLDEIPLANTLASFEPALDYVVTKMPRFPFDKFVDAKHTLGTQMKATGEVMSIGRTIEESLLKAIRSLEIGAYHLYESKFDNMSAEQLILTYIQTADDPDTTDVVEGLGMNASWLYIDPSIGNDTNSNEISTSVGGWWYLIVDNGGTITGANDTYADTPPAGITASGNTYTQTVDRSDYEATDANRLQYYLYEIVPNIEVGDVLGTNGQKKIASSIIPFVNGTFALPGDALTNVFANAKLSFTVSVAVFLAFSTVCMGSLLGIFFSLSVGKQHLGWNRFLPFRHFRGIMCHEYCGPNLERMVWAIYQRAELANMAAIQPDSVCAIYF